MDKTVLLVGPIYCAGKGRRAAADLSGDMFRGKAQTCRQRAAKRGQRESMQKGYRINAAANGDKAAPFKKSKGDAAVSGGAMNRQCQGGRSAAAQ